MMAAGGSFELGVVIRGSYDRREHSLLCQLLLRVTFAPGSRVVSRSKIPRAPT